MVLCEAGFPKKLAFAYLEDLQTEFNEQHGKKVPTVSRPYSFIEFGERGAKQGQRDVASGGKSLTLCINVKQLTLYAN